MESYFIKLFDNIHYERSLFLILSITDSNVLVQAGFTNDEIIIIKNIALQKIKKQVDLKQYFAMNLLEKQIDKNV